MKKYFRFSNSGFTIVELLIVIVVIAILAAITVVAFNGVQNRANDSAVQANVTQLYKKLQLAKESGELSPENLEQLMQTVQGVSLSGLDTRQEYPILISEQRPNATYNYETQSVDLGEAEYSIAAVSKSGQVFYASQQTGGTTKAFIDWNNTKMWLNQSLDELNALPPEELEWYPAGEIERIEAELTRIDALEASGEYGWRVESSCYEWQTEQYPDWLCIDPVTYTAPLPAGYNTQLGGYVYSSNTGTWSPTFQWHQPF